ncbi:MAG: DUF4199 domain-containing protein [Bacteroidetes bacterium]|nr:DUF4199 domain-containing protein [Bacteroidota bacterium]
MNTSIIKKIPVWYGIYYGITSIAVFTIVYLVNFELFGKFILWGAISLAIPLVFYIAGGIAERKQNGGFLKYKQAFIALFIIGIVGYLINLTYTIVFTNVIDKQFNTRLEEVVTQSTANWLEKYKMDQEKIDMQMEKIHEQFANANTTGAYIKQLLWAIVVSAIISAIIALIIKRNPPENFMETDISKEEN